MNDAEREAVRLYDEISGHEFSSDIRKYRIAKIREAIQRAEQRGREEVSLCPDVHSKYSNYGYLQGKEEWYCKGLLRGAEIAEHSGCSTCGLEIAEAIRKEAGK